MTMCSGSIDNIKIHEHINKLIVNKEITSIFFVQNLSD
jgi:hypothetical protein